MKKSRLIIVCILILLLLSITGCSVFKTKKESISKINTPALQKSNQTIKSSENKTTNKPTWDVVFERVYQNTEKYKIDVYIPKIIGNGLKQEVYEKINSVLKKYAEQQIEHIKKVSAEAEGDSGLYPYYLYIGYEWDKSVEPYISFLFEEYSDTGGAHGLTQIIGFTFDLRTGESIKLVNKYLNNDQRKLIYNYINFARALCNDLDDPPYEVFNGQDNQQTFDEDLFEDMVFKNNGLLVCFEPYKIASYARGVVRFWFDLDELRSKEVNKEFDLSDYSTIKKLLSMNLSEIRKEFGLPVEIYSFEGGLLYKTKSGVLFSFSFNSVERLENITKAYVNSFSSGNNIKLFGISLKGSLSELDKKLKNIKELRKISEGIDEEWGTYFVSYELAEAIELYIDSKTSDKNSDVSYILVKKKRF